jgi:hypothetical protein
MSIKIPRRRYEAGNLGHRGNRKTALMKTHEGGS